MLMPTTSYLSIAPSSGSNSTHTKRMRGQLLTRLLHPLPHCPRGPSPLQSRPLSTSVRPRKNKSERKVDPIRRPSHSHSRVPSPVSPIFQPTPKAPLPVELPQTCALKGFTLNFIVRLLNFGVRVRRSSTHAERDTQRGKELLLVLV